MLRNIVLFFFGSVIMLSACHSGSNGVDTSLIHNPGKPLTKEDSARMPILVFDTLEHNFGNVHEGDQATYDFRFTNRGKGNLLLTEVHATCGCTTPYYPKHIIKPEESDAVKVIYDSKGRLGAFRKGIVVTSNTYPNTTKLIIGGTVIPATNP